MDRIPCAPNDNNPGWIPQQRHGDGLKGLKDLLFCTTVELERERAKAEEQRRLHEDKLLHLQELLNATRRERDEAREQLMELDYRLAEFSMVTNTQPHAMSSDRFQWPAAMEIDELNPSTTSATRVTIAGMRSNSSPLVGLADEFQLPNFAGHHLDWSYIDMRSNVDLHQPPTSSSKVDPADLIYELQEQPSYHDNEQYLSIETEQQRQVESHLPPLIEDISTDYTFWQQEEEAATCIRRPNLMGRITESLTGIREPSNLIFGEIAESSAGIRQPSNLIGEIAEPSAGIRQPSNVIQGMAEPSAGIRQPSNLIQGMAEPSAGIIQPSNLIQGMTESSAGIRQPLNLIQGIPEPSAGALMTYQDPDKGFVLGSAPSIINPVPVSIPAHLPEPPESNLQVILKNLPERGKLLQAVMRAGPLLQTLLLAGPLPQWRYPPPTLDTLEIPRISMRPSTTSLSVGPMTHHVPRPQSSTAAMDPLQVTSSSAVSLPRESHSQRMSRTRFGIPITEMISSPQSGSAAESSSPKLLCPSPINYEKPLPS